jgi:hypothetical protein
MRSAIASVLAVAAASLLVTGCGDAATQTRDAAAAPAAVAAAGTTTVAPTTAAPPTPATTPATPPDTADVSPAAAVETVRGSPVKPAKAHAPPKLPAGAQAPSVDAIRAQLKRAAEAEAARTRKAGRSAFGPPATPAQERAVRMVFDRIVTAVGAQDWPAACDLLLPAMRAQYATLDGQDGCPAAVRQYVRQRGSTEFALRDLRVKGGNATGLNDGGVTVVFVSQRGRWYLASPL